MKTAIVPSPLGEILLAAEGGALCGLWFAGQKYEGAGLPADVERISAAEDEILSRAARWLTAYFAGEAPALDFPLAPRGTVFQKRVWQALTEIPYGSTSSYGLLAETLGCKSARAVGAAVGRNPISILIPCHRVLGADGGLTGYAGGLARKQALLALEGAGTERRKA